jgi:hypothetical protein
MFCIEDIRDQEFRIYNFLVISSFYAFKTRYS